MDDPLTRVWIWDRLARIFDGEIPDLSELPAGLHAISGPIAARLDALREAIAGSAPDDVRADHVRLFVTARDGVPAPPYESWYVDGELFGASCRRVEALYAAQGVARDAEGGQPADYLSAELEFLYFLARHEVAARAIGDAAARQAARDAGAAFLRTHLARWVPPFVARIRAARPTPVFAAAAGLLEAAVADRDSP